MKATNRKARAWDNRRNITTDIAYIAGLFDGEGCVRIKRANQRASFYITVTISNMDMAALLFVQERFGGKIYTQGKAVFQFYITSGEAVAFLKTMANFTIIKAKQVAVALDFANKYPTLSAAQKVEYHDRMRKMKKNPRYYENPALLPSDK